jgi:hypothetical protein
MSGARRRCPNTVPGDHLGRTPASNERPDASWPRAAIGALAATRRQGQRRGDPGGFKLRASEEISLEAD